MSNQEESIGKLLLDLQKENPEFFEKVDEDNKKIDEG